jgi:hypothetical protein
VLLCRPSASMHKNNLCSLSSPVCGLHGHCHAPVPQPATTHGHALCHHQTCEGCTQAAYSPIHPPTRTRPQRLLLLLDVPHIYPPPPLCPLAAAPHPA